MFTDCQGLPYPVFAKGVVSECAPLVGAVPFGSVYSLKVLLEAGSQEPAAGQFYMLHAVRSDVLLGRPISVFHSEVLSEEEGRRVELTFLILLKGQGTKELCSLDFGDLINLIGPCGNRFPVPQSVVECAQPLRSLSLSKGETTETLSDCGFDTASGLLNHRKVLIIGGGIGVAPVAGFAETLPPQSYDFYASFKSGSYGLENLKADKLFFMLFNEEICAQKYSIPEGFALSETGNIPAMNLEEVDRFVEKNFTSGGEVKNILKAAQEACRAGVTRVHILNGNLDGVLPCEIFSGLGSGTMIYTGGYGKVRQMEQTDIPSVLAIMKPFVESGKLLPRTEAQIAEGLEDYIVYELDGGIHACAALHFYEDGQAEIAAVAVDENYAHMGIGPKLIDTLIGQAGEGGAESIFIMTTQTADWFEKLGFEEDTLDSIPEERRKLWDSRRGSKVFRLKK